MSTPHEDPGMSPRLAKAIGKVADVAAGDGRRRAEEDRKRRQALGDTLDQSLSNLDDDTARSGLFTLLVDATAGNRNRIATHALVDDALLADAAAEVAHRREVAEAARAEAAELRAAAKRDKQSKEGDA